jgi:hypothetical protein
LQFWEDQSRGERKRNRLERKRGGGESGQERNMKKYVCMKEDIGQEEE